MKRVRVVYRPDAVTDIEEILRFVLRLSRDPETARRYAARIRDRCGRIGDLPLGGTPRDDLVPGLRTIAFERRAVIAYRLVDDQVEITNIFHGGRDFEALYRGREEEET